jgi:putative hydrolase of the HAD superfamily
MLDLVPRLKKMGLFAGILSDQTQWLDELNDHKDFFKEFDHVFNSYHMGKAKDDPALFEDIASRLNLPPERILFVDDHEANIERAGLKGFRTILYRNRRDFLRDLAHFCPSVPLYIENE